MEQSANGRTRTTHYTYSADGRFVTEKIDEMGENTTYEWDGEKNLLLGNPGAVTLGSYINGSRTLKADPNNQLFQHEYGHYLQSQEMGPGYLSRVGVPNLMNTAFYDDDNHKYQPYEQDANRRAFLYFNREVDGFYETYEERNSNREWGFYNNPLDVNHIGK